MYSGESDVKMEAEIGVEQLQTEECWQPAKAGTAKEQVLPWGLQRECNLLMP